MPFVPPLLSVPAIALTRANLRLCLFTAIGGQGAPHVVTFRELPVSIAPDKALIATGID